MDTGTQTDTELPVPSLIVSEVCADNEGVLLDEALETEDWIELQNVTDRALMLEGYTLSDRSGRITEAPAMTLGPGETVVLFADEQVAQGERHLRFSLSSSGDEVRLRNPQGELIDEVRWESLGVNEVLARFGSGRPEPEVCPFASPARPNGEACEPMETEDPPPEVEFSPFMWPQPWPAAPGPLMLTELSLRPAEFIEVRNVSAQTISLDTYELRLATIAPGDSFPARDEGVLVPFAQDSLAPGEVAVVKLSAAHTAALEASPQFEGVVTLWGQEESTPVDRVDFMSLPQGAALTRTAVDGGVFRLCSRKTPGEASADCDPILSRPIGNRVRRILTPGDFAALAAGGTEVGCEAVKIVVDLEDGGSVHFLGNAWDLHYTFVRELIEGQPHLDRCDPTQAALFNQGWGQFSKEQYYEVDGRRYLLGTLVHYPGSELHTLEFVAGDRIVGSQMRTAMFAAAARVPDPSQWFLRPSTSRQVDECLSIDGTAPITDPAAPFRGMTYQTLNAGEAFGVLRFVPASEIFTSTLGYQVIAITDLVPNDLPMVGGLITESFQTPLSHVSVLSRARGTPDMALRDARRDPRIEPLLGKLVHLVVTPGGFEIQQATAEQAEAFWQTLAPPGEVAVPRLDTTQRQLRALTSITLDDLPAVGAKAAALGQLGRIESGLEGCPGMIPAPRNGFAVPVVYSLEHYASSGASDLLAEFERDPEFRTNPLERAKRLAQVRDAILAAPVDAQLLAKVEAEIETRFGTDRVRLRSSSNTEDLVGFNGAGLYTSTSAAVGDRERTVADALRTVWASLMNARAYDERMFANIDGSSVAMGVLVHEAFLSEEANGVLVTRNILDPTRSDQYYVNAQAGEASVTNPAPGVLAEQLVYHFASTPYVEVLGRSSLIDGEVLSPQELERLVCLGKTIHAAFRGRLDPMREQRWFAMDIEWKLVDQTRRIAIKQARPYSFGKAEIPQDCREF